MQSDDSDKAGQWLFAVYAVVGIVCIVSLAALGVLFTATGLKTIFVVGGAVTLLALANRKGKP